MLCFIFQILFFYDLETGDKNRIRSLPGLRSLIPGTVPDFSAEADPPASSQTLRSSPFFSSRWEPSCCKRQEKNPNREWLCGSPRPHPRSHIFWPKLPRCHRKSSTVPLTRTSPSDTVSPARTCGVPARVVMETTTPSREAIRSAGTSGRPDAPAPDVSPFRPFLHLYIQPGSLNFRRHPGNILVFFADQRPEAPCSQFHSSRSLNRRLPPGVLLTAPGKNSRNSRQFPPSR